MSISSHTDLSGIKKISEIVGEIVKEMRQYAQPGMSTKELDEYGGSILQQYGARSAPLLAYGFPGYTCISLNHEIAHGIPSHKTILQEGDLVNIDVSAELNGFWSDNGGSFVLGKDIHQHTKLVDASRNILYNAIQQIKAGLKIAELGRFIHTEAKKSGYTVIKNLTGHGIGKKLHEEPREIPCYYDRFNQSRFKKNSVVAIETFISTKATFAHDKGDGWTMITNDGSYVAQHEHTIIVTDDQPIILTTNNEIWN
jgi:methionyl aminopeptidase